MSEARYVVDEHVSDAVVEGLRRSGIDVIKFAEIGRSGRPDTEQLEWAQLDGRVIITHDNDYIKLARAFSVHPGIGYCHQVKYRRRVGDLIQSVQHWHAELAAEDWANRVIFL